MFREGDIRGWWKTVFQLEYCILDIKLFDLSSLRRAGLAAGLCLCRQMWDFGVLLTGLLSPLSCCGQVLGLCTLGLEGWKMAVPSQGKLPDWVFSSV